MRGSIAYIQWNAAESHKGRNKAIAATWMELEAAVLSEVSQTSIADITYTWRLKNDTN